MQGLALISGSQVRDPGLLARNSQIHRHHQQDVCGICEKRLLQILLPEQRLDSNMLYSQYHAMFTICNKVVTFDICWRFNKY